MLLGDAMGEDGADAEDRRQILEGWLQGFPVADDPQLLLDRQIAFPSSAAAVDPLTHFEAVALDLRLLLPLVQGHATIQLQAPECFALLTGVHGCTLYGLDLLRVDTEPRSYLGRHDAECLQLLLRQTMPLDREVVLLAIILLGIPDALAFGLKEMALNDAEHVIRGKIKG